MLNDQALSLNLDLLEIKRDKAQLQMAANQQAVARSYNPQIKIQRFMSGDLILRKSIQKQGVFSLNWNGSFWVIEPIWSGSYKLEDIDGTSLSHLWNADKLRQYYQ